MLRSRRRIAVSAAAGALLAVAGCSGSSGSGPNAGPTPSRAASSPTHGTATSSVGPRITPASFGMHILGSAWPPLTFGSLRIWDDGVTWNKLQPSSGGSWDSAALARLDAMVKMARDHHVRPMLVLGQTPAWASSNPSAQGTYGVGAPAPPRHLSDWTHYVSFLAKRYRGRIDAYQVWNEPSFTNQWTGSVQQLAQLTKATHDAVKAADPRALVVSPGVPLENYKSMPFLRSYLPLIRGDVDVMAVHLYPAPRHAPESVRALVSTARTIDVAAGLSIPIWNTEENLGSRYSGDVYAGARAAALTARAMILAPELGIVRSYWYAADDHTWGAVALENSSGGTPTAAGVAERVVARILTGARPTGCNRSSAGAWQCTFQLRSGGVATAVWATGQRQPVHAPQGSRRIMHIDGSSDPARGTVTATTEPVIVIP